MAYLTSSPQQGGVFSHALDANITGQWAFSSVPLFNTTGAIVGPTDTQTLTNKTFTTPTLSLNSVAPGNVLVTQITAAMSGCIYLCAGVNTLYVLPEPSTGLMYDFLFPSTGTSTFVLHTPQTQFIVGAVMTFIANTTPGANPGPKLFPADGTTINQIVLNGTTKGGIKGTWMRLVGLSSTVWAATGILYGSGTIVTPFAAA